MEKPKTGELRSMNADNLLNFERFYNIRMSDFYEYAATILSDFGYTFHRSIKELPEKRRVELWKSNRNDTDQALVWVEITNSGADITKDIPIEVLRVMNEENLTKLFFFTNGGIKNDELETLDGKEHFIFTPSEIIESVDLIKTRENKSETKPKRKKVKVPSGFILIKNYLTNHKKDIKNIPVKVEQIHQFSHLIINQIEKIYNSLNNIKDIDNITIEERDIFKKMQYSLLPELLKISSLQMPNEVQHIKDLLFNNVKNLIVYIGTIIEYEAEEDVQKYKEELENNLKELKNIEDVINEYKKKQIKIAFKKSIILIIISVTVLVISYIFYKFLGEI